TFDNTYQTQPDTSWDYWNLIKFNEQPRDDGSLMWLMRKDQCMHCEDPGCLRACPADGAIVQYANGIVDFQQEHCIGCQYCVSGCPYDVPKFNPATSKVYKCTLCSDRVGNGLEPACIKACPTGCLKFGTKTDMRQLAEDRAAPLRGHSGYPHAGRYRPARRAAASAGGSPTGFGWRRAAPPDSGSTVGARAAASAIRPPSAEPMSCTCCAPSRSRSATAGSRPIPRFRRRTRSGRPPPSP